MPRQPNKFPRTQCCGVHTDGVTRCENPCISFFFCKLQHLEQAAFHDRRIYIRYMNLRGMTTDKYRAIVDNVCDRIFEETKYFMEEMINQRMREVSLDNEGSVVLREQEEIANAVDRAHEQRLEKDEDEMDT